MDTDEAVLRRRLALGADDDRAWLSVGEAAIVLGFGQKNRFMVHRMILNQQIRVRFKSGTGRHRLCHPDDLNRILAEKREVHILEPKPKLERRKTLDEVRAEIREGMESGDIPREIGEGMLRAMDARQSREAGEV